MTEKKNTDGLFRGTDKDGNPFVTTSEETYRANQKEDAKKTGSKQTSQSK